MTVAGYRRPLQSWSFQTRLQLLRSYVGAIFPFRLGKWNSRQSSIF